MDSNKKIRVYIFARKFGAIHYISNTAIQNENTHCLRIDLKSIKIRLLK